MAASTDITPNAKNPAINVLQAETILVDASLKAEAAAKPVPAHKHVIADVTGLQTALDGKQDKAAP